MKRSCLLLLTLLVSAGLTLAGCGESGSGASSTTSNANTAAEATADPGKVYDLTYALFQPEVSGISQANIEFAKEIERRTDGRVKITVHAGGSLLNAASMYQGVMDGVADMGNSTSVYDPGAFPFTSIVELPCSAQSGWAASNAFYDFMEKYQPAEWKDVHLLTTVGDAENFLTMGLSKKEIKTKEDWAGVSMRSMSADVVQAMGGTPKDLPMADLYDAISKGVVDGYMGGFEPYKSWKLADVVNWVTVNPAPVQFSAMWYNFMNKASWEGLPADIQQIITEVSREYSGKIGLAWDDQSIAGAEYVKSLGKTIYVLPEAEAARWTEAITPIVTERLGEVASKGGIAESEVQAMWGYFQERVDYWNGQQLTNKVTPLIERIAAVVK